MNLELSEKVALVTGSTSGIGEAIVRSFIAEGAHVVVAGRDEGAGQRLVDELTAAGAKAILVLGDLTDDNICQQTINRTVERFGRLDVLVNNAGVNDKVSLEDGSVYDFVRSLQRNLVHYFALAKYALPYLKESRGSIVNIGSKVAVTGQGGTSGYAASKGGIQALTREWAVSLRDHGIRVNEVVPAEVWTQQYENWLKTFHNPEEKKRMLASLIPYGHRFTTVQEIADTVVFLASARASHITGQHIYVDGGYTHMDRALT